jgi:hypothetical protein
VGGGCAEVIFGEEFSRYLLLKKGDDRSADSGQNFLHDFGSLHPAQFGIKALEFDREGVVLDA